MKELKSFFKDTAIYGLASVLPRIINFALVAVYTKVFDTAQFSSQTQWYVYAAFINVILTLGLETSFFRFYATETNKDKVISTSYIILTVSSVIFLIAGLVSSGFSYSYFGFEDSLFLKILIWTTVFDTLVVIPFALLRVSGRPVKFMVLKLANVLFLAVLTIILLIWIPSVAHQEYIWLKILGIDKNYTPDIIHIFIANVAASLFTLLCVIPEMTKIKWVFDKEILRKLLQYGLPIMVGGLAYVINENIDKLIIPTFAGEDANGIYSACYKLGVFMTLYITAFRMGAEPFFFNQAGKSDSKQKYSTIMTWFVIFGCVVILCVVGFVDLIAGVFLRQKTYLQGLSIVPIILLANLFSGIYNNLAIWYKLTDKTKTGMYISILGAMVTIGSLIVFVPNMGIMGGAIATLFTYATMASVSYFLGRKYYPVPYDVAKILSFMVVTALLCWISFIYFRGQYLVNLLIIAAFISVILKTEYTTLKALISKSPKE
ncbi:MAG: oligosaccharide flippase family protein [Saprospiraceae bacterium]